MLLILAFEPGE